MPEVLTKNLSGTYSVVVQLLSCVWLFATPWTAEQQASLSFTISQSLLEFMSIESVTLSNHLILWGSLLLLPSTFPSIRVFSNELALCIRWPKYWSFSFSVSFSNEYSGLMSFRMDWLDFLAVQGTLKSLLQHHTSKASILQCSAFFMVHLSHPYVTTGKRNRSFKLLLECHLLSAAHPDDLPVCSCILLLPGTSCSLILLCLLFFHNIYHPPRRSLIYLFFPVCCIACFFPPLLVFSPSRM